MEISGLNGMISNYVTEATQSKVKEEQFQNLLEAAMKKQDDAELKVACKEFESYFVQQMYSVMRQTVPEGTLTQKSPGRDMFEDMLDQEYSTEIAKGRGVGIADMLYRQLSKK